MIDECGLLQEAIKLRYIFQVRIEQADTRFRFVPSFFIQVDGFDPYE
jgi:hypothetical protein